MNPLKKLAGQTAIYGLSSIVGRMINFILVPFYTGIFTTGEYGDMSYFLTFVAFFNVIYTFGMETTYFRFSKKVKEQQAFNFTMSFVILISGILSGLLLIFSKEIASILDYQDKVLHIQVLAFVMFFDAVAAIPLARLREKNQPKIFAITKLVNIFTNVSLNILFIVIFANIVNDQYLPNLKPLLSFYHNYDRVFYIFVILLTASLIQFPFLLNTIKGFRFSLNKALRKKAFNYAFPIMILGLAYMVNEMIDRILLREILPANFYPGKTNEQVIGIYAACYKFSMFITLVVQAFRYAAEPFFFGEEKKENAKETFAEVMKWFILVCTILVVIVTLFKHQIGFLILRQSSYWEALNIVPILLFANLFLGIYYNLSIWYKLTDKTYFGTIITFIGAGITLSLNLILIPKIGYMGCAWATLACYFIMAVLSYVIGQKHYPIPYKIGSALKFIAISLTLIVINYYLDFGLSWKGFGTSLLLLSVFFTSIYMIERESLQRLFTKKS